MTARALLLGAASHPNIPPPTPSTPASATPGSAPWLCRCANGAMIFDEEKTAVRLRLEFGHVGPGGWVSVRTFARESIFQHILEIPLRQSAAEFSGTAVGVREIFGDDRNK